MPQNDSLLDDGILDPLDIDEGIAPKSEYVPKFERDLAAAGSLDALSAAKKATTDETAPTAEDDEISAAEAEDDGAVALVTEDDVDDVILSSDNEENPLYQYHTKAAVETAAPEIAQYSPKSVADFAREAEERAKAESHEQEDDRSLDDVDVSVTASMLSEMDYSSKRDRANSIKHQMAMDDLAMEMDAKPVLEEMSDEYAPTKKNTDELAAKAVLDRDERQMIKERLDTEISKRPEKINPKASAQMYKKLVHEQNVRKAKKGFGFIVLLCLIGIAVGGVTYFMLDWDQLVAAFGAESTVGELLSYVPYASCGFAVLMLLKLKSMRVFSFIYFVINTVVLIVPGFVSFAIDTNCEPGHYVITLVFYVLAILCSAFICLQLCTNVNIKAYYTTDLRASKKKMNEPVNTNVRTVRRK